MKLKQALYTVVVHAYAHPVLTMLVVSALAVLAVIVAIWSSQADTQAQEDLLRAQMHLRQFSYNCADHLKISYTAERLVVECVR